MKIRKIIISAILIILIFIITKCSLIIKEEKIEDNLKANSVYYAKNMKNTVEKREILIVLIDNLKYIKKPQIQDISYKVRVLNTIINNNDNNNWSYISNSNSLEPTSYVYSTNNDYRYLFDHKFKLHSVTQSRNKNIDISTVDEQDLIDEIYELVKPVIDAQTEPEENLQEEFNKRYKDKFN